MFDVREWIDSVASGLHFYAGVVITGGESQLPGVTDVARDIFDMETRLGEMTSGVGFPAISDPGASASIGLVKYCAARATQAPAIGRGYLRTPAVAGAQPYGGHPFVGGVSAGAQRLARPWGRLIRDWIWGFVPSRSDA
jgi:cell division ATPase FtsA